MASYLVLGCGVGKAIAYDLLNQEDTLSVWLGDVDFERAKNTVRSLKQLAVLHPTSQTISACAFDADSDYSGFPFGNFDVVISALPAKYNYKLSLAVIEAGRNFCDLGGVVDVTWEQMNLNQLAEDKKVSVVPDCGLMPGLGILMAKKLYNEMGPLKNVIIYVGGIPQKPRPPFNHQSMFNEEGLKSICYELSPILENGEIKYLPPFSRREKINVGKLKRFSEKQGGWIEAFVTAGASIAPWTFKENKWSENFSESTIRWEGFIDGVKDVPREEFSQKVSPYINIPVTADNPDLVWMEVEARSKSGKLKSYTLLDLYNEETRFTAMERTTGFTTSKIARMMASGLCATGVNTPETAFNLHQLNMLWNKLNQCFKIESFEMP